MVGDLVPVDPSDVFAGLVLEGGAESVVGEGALHGEPESDRVARGEPQAGRFGDDLAQAAVSATMQTQPLAIASSATRPNGS